MGRKKGKIMKRGLFVMGCLLSLCLMATPSIVGVTARQRYPWNGKVDIAFEVVGDPTANVPDGKVAELSVKLTDRATGRTYTAATLTGDTAPTEGAHRLVWDLTAQGLEVYVPNAVFSVAYEEKFPLYRVIDVSGGSDAAQYPVSFLNAAPLDGWSEADKTDRIVLRRIDDTNGVYYAGVFEVTEAQWDKVMGGASTSTKPKAYVSYNTIRGDAATYDWPTSEAVDPTSFMGRLRQKTGLATLDLPSEAEWEQAARAGVTTTWLCGDNETGLGDYAWYSANSGNTTHSVGLLRANAWGLYDVHGNVWEWCLDRYGSGPRVLRGGAYYYDASYCAFAYRDDLAPANDWGDCGFRLFCRSGSN